MLFPSVLPLLPPSDGQNEFSLLSPLLLDFGCPWQQRSVSSILLNVDIEDCVDDEVRMSVLTFSLAAFRHVQLIETSNLIHFAAVKYENMSVIQYMPPVWMTT